MVDVGADADPDLPRGGWSNVLLDVLLQVVWVLSGRFRPLLGALLGLRSAYHLLLCYAVWRLLFFGKSKANKFIGSSFFSDTGRNHTKVKWTAE